MPEALPAIAVTLGDVRGIGPEIVAKALGDPAIAPLARFVVVGPRGAGVLPATPDVSHEPIGDWTPRGASALAGRLAGAAIERAVALVAAGRADAIVTAPIDKHALNEGGYAYPGHTEMFAALTGARTAMMLCSERTLGGGGALRVVLATTHVALRDVPSALTAERIEIAAALTRDGLRRWFGFEEPRIALCALNPHAGDRGLFGDEDDRILAPAARSAGIAGPFAADTVFVRAMRGEFDAVVAPYHDVGMTAIKVAAFGSGVNVTLGLPFPRTSPDHGTALDIAGRGIADASSMKEAIRVAARMAARAAST